MKYLLMVLTGLFLICRIEAMEIKEMLVVGDGITKNAPMPELGWKGNWGMAATSEDKDYAHLLFALIRKISPGAKMNLDNIMYEDTMTGWVHLVGNSAELIIIQLGDNYNGGITPEEYGNAYRQMIEELRGEVNKTVICLGPWNNTKIEPFIENAAKSAGAKFISLAQIASDPANHAGADGVYPKLAGQPGNSGMKRIAREIGINSIRFDGEKSRKVIDDSTPALIRDSSKCIKCRRCVVVCQQIQHVGAISPQNRGFNTLIGPAFELGLADVPCVQCGQCAAICPVGAITEKSAIKEVWAALDDPTKFVIVQTAPAIRAALGECFGMEPGSRVTGKMVSALRQLGFDAVFDTNFTADLTIMEEGSELLTRLKKTLVDKQDAHLPMFTSCSPGWIKFAEYYYPQFLDNISTCKSPQQMLGAVAKTYYAKKIGRNPEDIVVASVMPCTAKKFEAQRPEMNSSGVRDVDYVLTTRELGRMIKQAGIDFISLPDSVMDAPLGLSSGAADIFANTGGVMEAAIRTAYELITGKELPMENLHVRTVMGLDGLKKAELKITGCLPDWKFLEGITLKVGVAHGLNNAAKVLELIKNGQESFHFVEIMTCPGGCIGGGGQPRFTDDETRKKRIHAIYDEDEGKKMRKSHDNPQIRQIYQEFLEKPLGEKSHQLLHTHYQRRNIIPE